VVVDDTSVRVRLEGRAELLDATELRYRAILKALQSWRWKTRLRKNAALVHEVARTQDTVDEALLQVTKRALVEGWDHTVQVMRCHSRVADLRGEVLSLVARRLAQPLEAQSLRSAIEALETQVLTAPRLVLPGQRWSTAVEVLPPDAPELQRAVEFGRRAERLFGRPASGTGRLPMPLDELDAFIGGWNDGVSSLEAVWKRLAHIDSTGAMVRLLRKRARRMPTKPLSSGPEFLLAAEFWRGIAVERMNEVLNDRLSPIAWHETERFPLLRWLWHREHNLPETPGIRDKPREALFELAAALRALPRTVEHAPLVLGGLIPVARLGDRLRDTDDWERLHDELRLLVREVFASRRIRPPRLHATLEGLVRALRDAG
jgi:hypothetical protein